MSGLSSKNILVVGDENPQIHTLEEELKKHGMIIHTSTCDSVNTELIEQKDIHLILLNHLHQRKTCIELLRDLNAAGTSRAIPVFALVHDTEEQIQEVLVLGAADYITPSESTDSVIQKIVVISGDTNTFAGTSDIDISLGEAEVSKTGIRVYVVEDDPLLRNLLSVRFERSSFPCEFNNDGQMAVQAMLSFKPDVILLDLMLPGKSGFEVLKEIKDNPVLSAIPVLIFSNRDSQEDCKQAKDLGAAGFHVKAMTDLAELVEKIESLTQ